MPHVLIKYAHVLICISAGEGSRHFSAFHLVKLAVAGAVQCTLSHVYTYNTSQYCIFLKPLFNKVMILKYSRRSFTNINILVMQLSREIWECNLPLWNLSQV